jgi:circadian clock protein KaiC
VIKLRESNFRAGYHDMTIESGGVAVFPRLVAAEHHEPFEASWYRVAWPSSTRSFAAGWIAAPACC